MVSCNYSNHFRLLKGSFEYSLNNTKIFNNYCLYYPNTISQLPGYRGPTKKLHRQKDGLTQFILTVYYLTKTTDLVDSELNKQLRPKDFLEHMKNYMVSALILTPPSRIMHFHILFHTWIGS
ncbi:MAG: hypothetical protein M3162_04460 [Thermoproteota archaeon]|nr:hypothetical protein [Thermoproteota archaeon]